MRKLFFILLSTLIMLGTYIVEGGSIRTLLCISSFIPVFFGPLFGALVSFNWAEIKEAFTDAFNLSMEIERQSIYVKDLEVIRHLSVSILFWAGSIIILALIGILSSVTHVDELGPHIAIAFTALLYGFATRSILLIPMESSIKKKLIQCQKLM